jgi:mannose/fructose/sorbose-specific phosphotransferase system IIB component
MEIGLFRIDDRLIHGQVITAWISYANATSVVVADDKSAGDDFQKRLLKMVTPDTIDLRIVTVAEAIELFTDDDTSERALLLVRGPKQALELVRAGVRVDQINVGNMNMKKGKTKILSNLWVFPEDVEAIEDIYQEGVALEVRAVPSEHSQDVLELLRKNGLVQSGKGGKS